MKAMLAVLAVLPSYNSVGFYFISHFLFVLLHIENRFLRFMPPPPNTYK